MTSSEVLALPETEIRFENGVLQQMAADGKPILQVDAADLKDLKTKRTVWFFSLVLLANGLNCFYLVYNSSSEYPVGNAAALIAGGLAFVTGVYHFFEKQLVVVTSMKTSKIRLRDSKEVVQEFIAAVKRQTSDFGQTTKQTN